jgi:hypothetical protein
MSRPTGPESSPRRGEVLPPRLGRPWDWLIGGTLFVGLLIAVEHRVGFEPLLAPWRTLPVSLLTGVFLLTTMSYVLRAVRVYDYFHAVVGGHFLAVLRLSILHNAANNLLPMRLGEVVFPWLMQRYFGHGFLAAGASLLWIRLMDLHSLCLGALVALWLYQPSWWWPIPVLLWLSVLPAGLAFRRSSWIQTLRRGRLRRLLMFLSDAAPADERRLYRLYLWTLLSWGAKLTAFALVLAHFVEAAPWQLLSGVLGAELSSILPFHGIAGAGSYELAGMVALVPVGVSVESALAGAVNLHLYLLGATLALGAIALFLPKPRSRAS